MTVSIRTALTCSAALLLGASLSSCTEEQQNKISRAGVTWLEGDYHVTYADGAHVKIWTVEDGKVTSDPAKGYYFFWAEVDGKRRYVQTPIERTYIEEI